MEAEAKQAEKQQRREDAWDLASLLNVAEDVKAGKHDGWTFSHFCEEDGRLAIAIQHRSGVYAVVHNGVTLGNKVREYQQVDAYIATQIAAQVAAAAPALPKTTPVLQAVPPQSEALS